MGKNKKKDKGKKSKQADRAPETERELLRLRAEVEELKARLERIVELARAPVPSAQLESDEEDDEYEELSHDVDDQIAGDRPEPAPATR